MAINEIARQAGSDEPVSGIKKNTHIMPETNIERLFVDPSDTIADAARIVQHGPEKIALVIGAERELLGTITDPLVRSALLLGHKPTDPVRYCMHATPDFDYVDQPQEHYEAIMDRYGIDRIPLLDRDNRIAGVATVEPDWKNSHRHPLVVIMAGGLGTRLSPLTDSMPKPMVEIGGKPLLEQILLRFRACGFREFAFSVNYMADVIEDHFGDGSRFGCSIQYVREAKRMGTAGSLSLLTVANERPVFVTNGDVLSGVDYEAMMTFHCRRAAEATIAVNTYSEQIQFGVITVENQKVVKIEEKPVVNFLANSGIYIVQGSVLKLLPKGEFFDMPTLLNTLAEKNDQVIAYPLHEYWQDIGNLRDLDRARKRFDEALGQGNVK